MATASPGGVPVEGGDPPIPDGAEETWDPEKEKEEAEKKRQLEAEEKRKNKLESWDSYRNEQKDAFALLDGERTCVLRSKHAGTWHSICSDVSFVAGVHFLAVKVTYNGEGACPSPSLSPAWMMGVSARNVPLETDVVRGGDNFARMAVCGGQGAGDTVSPAFWSVMYTNHRNCPFKAGEVLASPPTVVVGVNSGREETMKHNGRVFHGDVIGVRADLDEQTVTFYVNGEKVRKPTRICAGGGGWVVLLSSATPSVRFTILSNDERAEPHLIAPWKRPEQIEMEDNEVSGAAKNATVGERNIEMQRLAFALTTQAVGLAAKMVEGGAFVTDVWPPTLHAQAAKNAFKSLKKLQLPLLAQPSDDEHDDVEQDDPLLRKQTELHKRLHEREALHKEALGENRASKEVLETLRKNLVELRRTQEEFAGLDMGLRIQDDNEEKRLKTLISKAESHRKASEEELEAEEDLLRIARADAQRIDRRITEIQEHTKSLLYRMYRQTSSHVRKITSSVPTFSAPDAATAEDASKRRALGGEVAENECEAAKRDDATGALSVVLRCEGEKGKIYYTTDGREPNEKKSPSVLSGRTVTITASCSIRAISVIPGLEASRAVVSPFYIVRASAPTFNGNTSGKGRVRVQMRCKTPGVKIYYSLNSPEDAPLEWAVDGGNPTKTVPFGTGPGKRDGSIKLMDSKGKPNPIPQIAGVIENHESLDVTCTAYIHAMASKPGLADSVVAKSPLYSIENK